MTKLGVNVHPGRLPEFSDQSAIFFANLLSIFYGNAGKTDALRKAVLNLRSYGGRLLPILDLLFRGKSNLLALEMEPNKELLSYLRDVLDLSLPEVIVLPRVAYESLGLEGSVPDSQRYDALVERLREHPAELIDGFVTDTLLVQIAERIQKQTLSTLQGSINSNNKLHLHRHLESIGLPVFDTRVAEGFQAVDCSVPCIPFVRTLILSNNLTMWNIGIPRAA